MTVGTAGSGESNTFFLDRGLGIQWQRPSPKLWTARQAVWAVITTVVVLAAVVPVALTAPAVASISTAAGIAVASAWMWLLIRGRYRSWGYAEREDDLVVRRGMLFRRLTVVPYGRMQLIDVTAGPIERIFGLASVKLHTAAAATDARVPGLPAAEADRLRDRLAQLGESRAAGL